MGYREYSNRIDLLIYLLKHEKTGTAQELASRLGISRRTVFDYLSYLKDEGMEIKFCRQRKNYYIIK